MKSYNVYENYVETIDIPYLHFIEEFTQMFVKAHRTTELAINELHMKRVSLCMKEVN